MFLKVRSPQIGSVREAEQLFRSIGTDPGNILLVLEEQLHRFIVVEGLAQKERAFLRREMQAAGGSSAEGRSRTGQETIILVGSVHQLRGLCARLEQFHNEFTPLVTLIAPFLKAEVLLDRLWHIGRRILDLSRRPALMGILNVTPDSFSDGSCYSTWDKAVDRALEMEAEGADIIDIGGESTRPDAVPVTTKEELSRVMPVIERLAGRLSVPLSIDTTKSEVAAAAVNAGVEIVNDISGLTFDSEMATSVAATDAGLVLMHTRGTPTEMQQDTLYGDTVAEVSSYLLAAVTRAESAGIRLNRIVVDPGIGFGKSPSGNLELLRRLRELNVAGCPVLVGTSRKSFIGKILDRGVNDRLFGTAATVAIALANGASIVRVHDVKEMRDVVDMTTAILDP